MNAIAVLANNMNFVGYMLANKPHNHDKYKWIFVNETRIGNKIDDLKRIVNESGISDFEIIDSVTIVNKAKDQIINNDFIDSYTMGMNILMLWYIFRFMNDVDKVLLVDDDVLLFSGIDRLFETDHNLFCTYRLSAGGTVFNGQSKTARHMFFEWFKIFEIKNVNQEWWENNYIKKSLSSGNRLIVKKNFDLKRYEVCLRRFFENEFLKERWDHRRVATSGFFDERFETFYYIDESNSELNKDTLLVINKTYKIPDSLYKRIGDQYYSIVHIANKSWKQSTYDQLVERGIINDRLA